MGTDRSDHAETTAKQTKSAVEGIVWAQMEATMACYAGGGEGLYAALHPFVNQAYQKGMETAAKICEDTERFYGKYHADRIRAMAAEDE